MTKYAEQTSVPSDRSRAEIEATLRRYGADQFMYGWDREQALICFRAENRQVRFRLPLPSPADNEIYLTPTGRERSPGQREAAYEQAVRQRWRALALVIKAKLEAVETGITVFEDEFMAHIMLPNGSTVSEWMTPQIAHAYETGQMPSMMPALGAGS